jgi:two-component system chemotaxis response regulator CheB
MKDIHYPNLIRVLVVEDSDTARELLIHIFNSDPAIQVVGAVTDGVEAVSAAERLRPDVISMDIHLPKMDGFTATRKIMETCPTRIIMVTASAIPHEIASSFNAIEAGALTVLPRPLGFHHPDYLESSKTLIDTVKLMAEIKVVKRRNYATSVSPNPYPPLPLTQSPIQLIVIGASTGGPLILQTILANLSKNLPVPVVIVQHISKGFVVGFAEWLSHTTSYTVQIATHGEIAKPNVAYLAPDDMHIKITKNNILLLSNDPDEYNLRPSIAYLFRATATEFSARAVGVLLTGMGRDGAKELKLMRDSGCVTIAQNEETSIVYGMPAEAVKLNAATYVLPPLEIAALLNQLTLLPTNQELSP